MKALIPSQIIYAVNLVSGIASGARCCKLKVAYLAAFNLQHLAPKPNQKVIFVYRGGFYKKMLFS